jgi:hypothetical protein
MFLNEIGPGQTDPDGDRPGAEGFPFISWKIGGNTKITPPHQFVDAIGIGRAIQKSGAICLNLM